MSEDMLRHARNDARRIVRQGLADEIRWLKQRGHHDLVSPPEITLDEFRDAFRPIWERLTEVVKRVFAWYDDIPPEIRDEIARQYVPRNLGARR